MNPFKNLTITAFGDCLTRGTYTFHSGFEHIDNFINTKSEFVSIADNNSYLAPNTIIINDFVSEKYTDIFIDEDFAYFNKNKHLLNKELQHSSDFKYPEITCDESILKIENFIKFHAADFPQKSLFFLLYPKNKQYFTSAFERAFVQQMEWAFSLFPTALPESIKAFKSRGSGLTPSGDDFIAGALFGFDFLEKQGNIKFDKIKNTIYELSKSNNVFSNNMLRMAYHAKYFKRLQDFLNAFFYLPLNDVSTAFEQLIAVGDTSGADLLTGFLAVILVLPQSSDSYRNAKKAQRI